LLYVPLKLFNLEFETNMIWMWFYMNCSESCKQVEELFATFWNLTFRISHIYRKTNVCGDRIANDGFFIDDLVRWDTLPYCFREGLSRDKFDLSNYRFG